MPIYEYKCNQCGHVFDMLVPLHTEGDQLACPKCGHVGARRLVSAFAAHGLENGHIAVGQKLTSLDRARASGGTGKSAGSSSDSGSSSSGEAGGSSAAD